MKLKQRFKLCILATFVALLFTTLLVFIQLTDSDEALYRKQNFYSEKEKKQFSNYLKKHNLANSIEKTKFEYLVTPTINNLTTYRTKKTTATFLTSNALKNSTLTTNATNNFSKNVLPEILEELKEKETSHSASVHIFYYAWYGEPEFDEKYYHWNHHYLDSKNQINASADRHKPPGDIASVSYPQLGAYSSQNLAVIERHMKWLSSSGVDVVVVSWYPKDKFDLEGKDVDNLIPLLLNMTEQFKMKLTLHLEPYKERSVYSICNDIKYIIKNYGSHPAFYRTASKVNNKKSLPLFYVYDSYLISLDEWLKLTNSNGELTIRNTEFDSLLIGLYIKEGDYVLLKNAGFDGIYTYFASEGFSHGSTMNNWPELSNYCSKTNLLFIPSVGPGYDDSRVRPWNKKNTRLRQNGEYYKEHFKMAYKSKADIVSITSFNEWHEGTQIEPAVPFTDTNNTNYSYQPYDKEPEQYLKITLEMVNTYFTPHHKNIPIQISKVV